MSARRDVTDPKALAQLQRLDTIADALEVNETERERLYAERTEVFLALRDMGVTGREIAEHARVTEMAVTKMLRKARETVG